MDPVQHIPTYVYIIQSLTHHLHGGKLNIFCNTVFLSECIVRHHIFQGRMEIVCSLHSVCTNAQDKLNALHLAASGGHVEIVKYLIPKFGDRRFDMDNVGNTCLHWAAREGHLAVVKYLIEECGFNANLANKVNILVCMCVFCMLFPHSMLYVHCVM